MALLEIHCKTCGNDLRMDIGDKTVEQVQKLLESRTEFECYAGHHFEMDSPINHWVLGKVIDGSAPSEDDWYKTMSDRYGILYSTDELPRHFEVTGFACGMCMAKVRTTGQEVCLGFIHSPKGVRYYHE